MIRGQRFELDLSPSSDDDVRANTKPLPAAFVADVLERNPAAPPKPPSAPARKSSASTGFPLHARRPLNKSQTDSSRFRQRQHETLVQDAATPVTSSTPSGATTTSKTLSEKEQIDLENRQRLDAMTPAEIEEERRQLMDSFSPAFIQRLLRRADLQSASYETDLAGHQNTVDQPEKHVSFADSHDDNLNETQGRTHVQEDELHDIGEVAAHNHDVEPAHPNSHGTTHNDDTPYPQASGSVHFPKPSQPPDLDPSSATFLTDLHEKYFPSLPSDPAKLAWMQPSDPDNSASQPSSYDPTAASFRPADIRFSFRGELLAPKTAASIPVTAGLHHHADAPDAAGYTIPELAHLSRSTVPAQRCIAFQTLGRVLYRLGRGEFGNPSDPEPDPVSVPPDDTTPASNINEASLADLARGLWREVDQLQVVATLVAESEGRGIDAGRHLSARAYATEAVWLWQKGGGRRWTAA